MDIEIKHMDFQKAMDAQAWKVITWMTVLCSAMTTAVFLIARHVP